MEGGPVACCSLPFLRVGLLSPPILLGGAAWPPSLGWCCFSPPFQWCCLPSPSSGGVFPSLLLGGAAWSPRPLGRGALPLSSVGWCCLPSLLRLVVLSSLRSLGWCFFLIFREPAPPRGGRRRQHDQKEEAKQPHPQGKGGKAAPLKGRRRDHHSTELNLTSFDLTDLNFLNVSNFFLINLIRVSN